MEQAEKENNTISWLCHMCHLNINKSWKRKKRLPGSRGVFPVLPVDCLAKSRYLVGLTVSFQQIKVFGGFSIKQRTSNKPKNKIKNPLQTVWVCPSLVLTQPCGQSQFSILCPVGLCACKSPKATLPSQKEKNLLSPSPHWLRQHPPMTIPISKYGPVSCLINIHCGLHCIFQSISSLQRGCQ